MLEIFTNQLDLFILFFGALAYIVIIVILVLNRGVRELLVRYLIGYILVSFILDLVRFVIGYEIFDLHLHNILKIASVISLVGISILLLKICSLILPIKSDNRLWFISALLWMLGLIYWGYFNQVNQISFTNNITLDFSSSQIFNGLAVFGWAGVMSRIVYLTFNSHRIVNRPLHKNRLNYWTISLLLLVIGDVLFFRDVIVVGCPLHLIGVSLVIYIVITHNLIDILRTSLQSLRYLIITFFTTVVYALVLLILQPIIEESPGYDLFFGALFIAAVLAFMINPIVDVVSKRINRSLLGMDYDPGTVMREYSHKINNIVDLKLLEEISMDLFKQTFDVDDGHLYVVEDVIQYESAKYILYDVCKIDEDSTPRLELQSDDSIARSFSEKKSPLTQYDLDYHPMYRNRVLAGRSKFLHRDFDVYVPIHQDEHWIGLFAVGPKKSGYRYYDEELLLMETLADQSAVALENAKLFTRLQQINRELTQTRIELEDVNEQLLEIDQLKSAFISVITHEMRTPLANLAFALQIFEMYGLDNFTNEQKNQLVELHQGLVRARRMVDDLVTFAAFINNQANIQTEIIDINQIVTDELYSHRSVAKDRGVDVKYEVKGENFKIEGDSKLIANAVYQLINNAVKFSQDGGSVIVSCWESANGVAINVRDNGIGITTERMENIWDAFAATSNPLQRGWEGLGLGLALVKLIIEAHGGRVWGRSKIRIGSDFGFNIPYSMKNAEDKSTIPSNFD